MKIISGAIFVILITLFPSSSFADDRFLGSWENAKGTIFYVINGFRSGLGPVLVQEPEGNLISTKWVDEDGIIKINYEYSDYIFSMLSESNALLTSDYGSDIALSRIEKPNDSTRFDIRKNPKMFVETLVSREWITGDGNVVFKSTFSEDSGVATTSNANNPTGSTYWAVSSDILRFGDDLLLEAKITKDYLVGLDEYDNFLVLKSKSDAPGLTKTNLELEKDEFFDLLLSGEWSIQGYLGTQTYKFRPIFGDLAGLLFEIQDDKLVGETYWEYSPSSGSLDLGYSTYPEAVIVNNTLALKDEDGNQFFYNRNSKGPIKRFTLADVTTIPLNELSTPKIKDTLNGQLQRGSYLHTFEFKGDGRKGFAHQFRSTEFEISGETLSNEFTNDAQKLFKVEDFLVFDSEYGPKTFKMDESEARLKPKSDKEVVEDVEKQKQLKSTSLDKRVIVRIKHKDGTTIDVPLPITDFSEIGALTLVRE